MYAADTIAAIATPPGVGGIGIVRVSGPLALTIAQRVFRRGSDDNGWESHRFYHGRVVDVAGKPLDDALVVLMRAPRSYTGEDVVELHCHGSPVALQDVLRAALAHGARLAEAGEFTRRAFLNGRLDLTQAEAVIELIRARGEAAATIAAEQLLGRLSRALDEIRSALVDIRAQLEVQIDFSEEEVAVDQRRLANDIALAREQVRTLLSSYHQGKLAREGLHVTITGKPNVGKSSLLNALLGEERAIVTAVPGTTRDTLEETVSFGGFPVVLSDTAGMRESSDPVEEIGVRRARAKLDEADIVIAVFDNSAPWDEEDDRVLQAVAARTVVAALNKSDLPGLCEAGAIEEGLGSAAVLRVSARTGAGLDDLRSAVLRCAVGQPEAAREQPTITLVRHRDALERAAESLKLALEGVRGRLAPELVAVDLQNAADHIGSLTGTITSEDVLDRIFSEFCIGK